MKHQNTHLSIGSANHLKSHLYFHGGQYESPCLEHSNRNACYQNASPPLSTHFLLLYFVELGKHLIKLAGIVPLFYKNHLHLIPNLELSLRNHLNKTIKQK